MDDYTSGDGKRITGDKMAWIGFCGQARGSWPGLTKTRAMVELAGPRQRRSYLVKVPINSPWARMWLCMALSNWSLVAPEERLNTLSSAYSLK